MCSLAVIDRNVSVFDDCLCNSVTDIEEMPPILAACLKSGHLRDESGLGIEGLPQQGPHFVRLNAGTHKLNSDDQKRKALSRLQERALKRLEADCSPASLEDKDHDQQSASFLSNDRKRTMGQIISTLLDVWPSLSSFDDVEGWNRYN